MSKFKSYIKSRTISWWLSSGLFAFLIVLLLFPGLRMEVMSWVYRQMLPSPDIEEVSEAYVWPEETYGFTYLDIEGKKHSLSEHKGKVLFVNFWGTWCVHCVAEMPSIQDLYDDYGDKVDFLLYSNRDSREGLKRFAEKKDYQLPLAYTDPNNTVRFSVPSYPTTYILGKDGVIVHQESGSADWNADNVRELLDDLLAE